MFYKIKVLTRKFWSLEGFVAIIFSLLALRAIYMAFLFVSFWNLLIAALMGIFAYWWLKKVLAKPGGCKRSRNLNNYKNRDIDL